MRRLVLLPLAMLITLMLASPASAARPTMVSFEDNDADDSVFYTQVCGFPVTADASGHVIFHNEKRGATNFIANWNIRVRLTSEHGSYFLVDVGPDMQMTRGGTTYMVVIGRSLTFSTIIGRAEVNLQTGEVTWHGKLVGSEPFDPAWYAHICDALDGAQ